MNITKFQEEMEETIHLARTNGGMEEYSRVLKHLNTMSREQTWDTTTLLELGWRLMNDTNNPE